MHSIRESADSEEKPVLPGSVEGNVRCDQRGDAEIGGLFAVQDRRLQFGRQKVTRPFEDRGAGELGAGEPGAPPWANDPPDRLLIFVDR